MAEQQAKEQAQEQAQEGHGKGAEGGHGGGGSHGGGGHGGGSHEEHEGAPEWLISFADNVTLMMGFFVILLAMNMKPASGGAGDDPNGKGSGATPDLIDFSIAVREGFNNPVRLDSIDPLDQPLVRRILDRRGESQASSPGPKGYEHDIQMLRPSDYFGLGGVVPFDDEAVTLSPTAATALAKISEQIRGHRMIIEVRGHVSVVEATRHEPRGMELSYERAMTVAQALTASGVDWHQIRIIACGDADPLVAEAYDEAQHRENRRVEIITTDDVVPN